MVTVSGAIKRLDARFSPKGTAVLTLWLTGEFAAGRVGAVKAKFFGAYAERLMEALQEGAPALVVGEIDGYKGPQGVRLEVAGRSLALLEGAEVAHREEGPYLRGATNEAEVAGYLGADPELRTVNLKDGGQQALATASLAVHRRGQAEPLWVPLKAWGEAASALARFAKGELVAASGRLRLESWEREGERRFREVLEVGRVLGGRRPMMGG